MINILIYFIIVLGIWSFITILSKGPKSYEASIIIKDILLSSKELIIKSMKLLKLLLQERNILKTTKGFNQEEKTTTINESNYAELINELYTRFREDK